MSTPKHRSARNSSYFVTTKCAQGRSLLHATEIAEILLAASFHYRNEGHYALHEFVIMPDHLHLILTPGANTSLEKTVQLIKGGSSHEIHKLRGHKLDIWQKGFFDWTIRDAADWLAKTQYIHSNPVRAGLALSPSGWPYSSANGKFILDLMPERYQLLASEAKA
jgi:putative transposase